MNATLKSILTNPFVIGGTALGVGVTAGAVIYAKHRPKTDAEIELEKIKEKNAEMEREREHQRELEKLRIKAAQDEIDAQERTKRLAKEAEERTKQIEKQLADAKELREYEKSMPQGYWDAKIAKSRADAEEAAHKRESDTQKEIARLQAEAARYSADANARAIEKREYYDYRKMESANNAEAAKTQALYGGIANIVNGVVTGKNP